jgi:galactose oxidase
VKLQALSEAGNRGPWVSAAEINIYTAAQALPPKPAGNGAWGPTIEFPVVPVSATIEYTTGNLLVWSSYNPSTFGGSNLVQTITAAYAPSTGLVTSTLVTNTQHDMFCEGLSMNFKGQIVATGGNSAATTSYYDSASNAWSNGAVSLPHPFLPLWL